MARILIIDDDRQTRDLVTRMLEDAGHKVKSAADGFEGLQMFSEQPPDLVITDIYMPGKEGLTTIGDIKFGHPETKIIAISGGIWTLDSSCALKAASVLGADLTLAKPVSKAKLLAAVDNLVAQQGSQYGKSPFTLRND